MEDAHENWCVGQPAGNTHVPWETGCRDMKGTASRSRMVEWAHGCSVCLCRRDPAWEAASGSKWEGRLSCARVRAPGQHWAGQGGGGSGRVASCASDATSPQVCV